MTDEQRKRANFSAKTKKLTAQRSGYRCSFPGCDLITIGPAKDTQKSLNNGIAAHIYGAATSGSGPRGTGGLSDDELKSSQNAIWLCGNHASLIDKHRGEEYPPEKLHSFKALHETRIAHELAGIHTPFGWIHSLKIHSSPLFAKQIEIEFAKLTLIFGGSSVGKTAICEWIAAVNDAQYLERWAKTIPSFSKRVSVEVSYHDPEPHSAGVSLSSQKFPEYKLDDALTVIPSAPLKVIFPTEVRFEHGEEQNDLKLVSKALNLHPYEIQALCEDMTTNGSDYVKHAWFEEDNDGGCYMVAEVQSDHPSGPHMFRALSGSERARVLMELGILAANRLAVMNPTLLILDSEFWRLDTNWLRRYADFLGSPTCNFQTIASIGPNRVNFNDLTWAGWKIVRLAGEPPDVMIHTDIREE